MEWVSSLIQALGTVVGAIVGALITSGYIKVIYKRNEPAIIRTYSDEDHNAHELMRKATQSIFIVVSIGDHLIEKHLNQMRIYLRKGVKLRFLIHNEVRYYELENYINADVDLNRENYKKIRNDTLEKLQRLKQDFPKQVEIRIFCSYLTASYIGIDIGKDETFNEWNSNSTVQMMVYQYGVKTKNNPITYFSFENNRKMFQSTVESILNMWHESQEFSIGQDKVLLQCEESPPKG